MKYLLDTDTFSQIARQGNASVTARAGATAASEMAISVITRGEVLVGLLKRPLKPDTQARVRHMLDSLQNIPLSSAVADQYADLRHHLERAGTPIGGNDLWIAAHALSLRLSVVTGNEREFRRVPGLQVENWLR